MSSPASNFRAFLFIAAFALWPAVVSQLVEHCYVDAWKLGGWGMYSDASNRVDVELYAYDQTGQIVLKNNDLPGTLDRMIVDFEQRRRVLGCFVRPEPLAAYVFERYSAAQMVQVNVGLVRFDSVRDYFESFPEQIRVSRNPELAAPQ